ncbi:MAG: DUF4386 domain-containing protein [Methyloceanibacter sp.]
MMERIAEVSPRFKARRAGLLYLLSVSTATFTELFARGRLNIAGGLIAISVMVVVTLLFYDLFKPVNRSLSFLAAFFSLVGLTFEALRWQPRGMNIAIVFAGFYCILIGYLIFRSAFLPRFLGVLMAFAGLGWLTYLSPPLVNYLSPYNLAASFLGEVAVFLWLLVMGVNAQRWREQATAAAEREPLPHGW